MCDCSLGKEENPSEPPRTLREVEERLSEGGHFSEEGCWLSSAASKTVKQTRRMKISKTQS